MKIKLKTLQLLMQYQELLKLNFLISFIGTRASEHQQLYRIIPKQLLKCKKQKLDLHGRGISDRNFIYMDFVQQLYSMQRNLGGIYISEQLKLKI